MRLGWGSTTGEQGDEGPQCAFGWNKVPKGSTCSVGGAFITHTCLQSSYRAFKQMSHPVWSPLDSVRFILWWVLYGWEIGNSEGWRSGWNPVEARQWRWHSKDTHKILMCSPHSRSLSVSGSERSSERLRRSEDSCLPADSQVTTACTHKCLPECLPSAKESHSEIHALES